MADTRSRSNVRPDVSIIVCTYNRVRFLPRLLRSLARQTLPADRFEVLVVDDGSRDATATVVEAARRAWPGVRSVANARNLGIAEARMAGVRAAVGDRLLFIDDDCIADPAWAARLAAALETQPLVAGAVDGVNDGYVALCHHVAQFYGFMSLQREGPTDFIAGANMGMRRATLEAVGGFRRVMPHAEDIEFVLRAREQGLRPYFLPGAVVRHDPHRTSLAGILRYAAVHAESTIHLRLQHEALLRTPWFLQSSAWLKVLSPLVALGVTARIYGSASGMWRWLHAAPVVWATKVAWCLGAARSLRRAAREGRP